MFLQFRQIYRSFQASETNVSIIYYEMLIMILKYFIEIQTM